MSSATADHLKSLATQVEPKILAGAIGSIIDYARYLRIGFLQPLDAALVNNVEFEERSKRFREQFGKDLNPDLLLAAERAVMIAPVSILPAPIPESVFNEARSLMEHFNVLMHKVAHDHNFLKEAYAHLIKVDDFQARLWHIYETVTKEGLAQPVCLQVNRNDFMIQHHAVSNDFRIHQVEINLFASSFGYFAERLAKLHRFSVRSLGLQTDSSRFAPNSNVKVFAETFVSAWRLYGDENAAVLFVTQTNERNIMDQRALEFAIQKAEPKIRVLRRTLEQIVSQAELNESTKQLLIRVNVNDEKAVPVAIVYFRAGYTPKDYVNEASWDARLRIERSNAIKCPNIAYHLANSKRVQQSLFEPGAVERFVSDSAIVRRIRATFVGQYSLNDSAAVQRALANPDDFVLKPNREGGGANLFHAELAQKLREVRDSEERFAYTLMERISPYTFDALLLSAASQLETALELRRCLLEFGVFGVLLGDASSVSVNRTCGYLVRTKQVGVDEGGVAAGFAALDSAYLV